MMGSDEGTGSMTGQMTQSDDVVGVHALLDHLARQDRLLRQARAAHERGALAEAERGYLELLSHDSSHAEASHLLGALRFQEGLLPEAEALIRRSIERTPSALALSNHAGVLAGLGRHQEALVQLDQALHINPLHLRALLQRAGILADLERNQEAVAAYDSLLAVAPTFIDGLCRHSMVLRKLGRFSEALVSCDRALAVDRFSFVALKERGQVLYDLGRQEDAVRDCGEALSLVPGDASVLFLRGVALLGLGQLESALASFNEAVAGSPSFTDALYNSAAVLERLNRFEQAFARCERVLALDPRHAKAFANRGNALQGMGRSAEAVESYARALELESDAIEVLCNQAEALLCLNRCNEALAVCQRALTLDGDYVPAWFGRGRVLQGLHRYEEALASLEHVLKKTPEDRLAHFQQGNVLTLLRRHEEAKSAFMRAIELDSDYVQAHCNLSFLCLSIADFRNGWEEYEWRWHDQQMFGNVREFAQPRWLGKESISGKTILLYAEQGLGDTLQFCRYVPLVKALGATVVLEAQVELKPLLSKLSGVDEFVRQGAPLPPFDMHCPLLSLPRAFQTELATIPSDVPYLQADSALVEKWRARLGTSTRPRIGLVWSGNPKHPNDFNRSMAFSELRPVLTDAFEWVSLQKVVRDEDRDALAASPVRHFGDEIADFSDTAALIEAMDCVLSVDTSVAHLAGALGRPLWVMLPHTPDFRWLLEREDNPWYPQARLFRQRQGGDWSGVFERLAAALPSLIAGD